jgi:glycosyltransferase involved in cell wall biosynthesis
VSDNFKKSIEILTPRMHFKNKILNILYLNLFAMIKVHKKRKIWDGEKPIFYMVGSFFPFLAFYLKYFLRIEVVVDVDTWFVCYDYSEVKATFLWYALEKVIEPFNKFFYSISINEFEANYLIKKGFAPNRVDICHVIIPDMAELHLKDKETCRQLLLSTYGIPPESVIIAFHGPGNSTHNRESVKMIARTATELSDLDKIKFLIIGDGYAKEEIIGKNKETSFIFAGFLDKERMYDILRGSDIYFCPIARGSLGGTKTKITEAAMLGLPVVTNSLGAMGYDKRCMPFLCDDDMAKSITNLFISRDFESLGKKCQEYIIRNYSYSRSLSFYAYLFSKIRGSGKN